MVKGGGFRYFKKSTYNASGRQSKHTNGKSVFKYSVYMQSRDSNWLNRNIQGNQPDTDPEPIEEDIRD